jgi:DNA-binding CsgD family transcriptional regulator/N-acetylneuraminic acid mutarotase
METRHTELSDREIEILILLSAGLSNKEIAARLFLSINTIKVHLRNVFAKIDVQSRTEATLYAIQHGYVSVPNLSNSDQAVALREVAAAPTRSASIEPPLPIGQRVILIGLAVISIGLAALIGPRSIAQSGSQAQPFSDSTASNTSIGSTASDTAWQALAPMTLARGRLAAASIDTQIVAIGGEAAGGVTGLVEIYDPSTQRWRSGANKPTPVANVSAAVANRKVIVPGGYTASGVPTTTVEAYDLTTDAWTRLASMPAPRFAYSIAVYRDQVYVFGGWDGSNYSGSVFVYDPATDQWATRTAMPIARGFSGAAALKNEIFVVGGYADGHEFNTCDRYQPEADQWKTCAPMTVARGGLGLVTVSGRVYAIGGGWTGYLTFSERYDAQADAWSVAPTPFTGQWRGMGATTIGNDIYALGGWSGQFLGVVEKYNPFPFSIFVPAATK